ncbi:MAG: YerC/YecD family TrpR-related protein [Megasphaera sp.]|jgi:TrpR-related protein YerC/YecD|nr:YerC/YecD family TrpR-related protein [Megasphaera sp.]MCI1247806.1 YerC/YecD family TrpR-related protein [Megasphaera sp.]
MSVNEKLRDHLHDQLFDAILELQDRDECYEFFEDICTIQEMHAIAIRLEVARMLKAGDIYEDIVKKTGASTATISRIKRCLMYGSGGYSKILDRMAGKNPDILKIEGRKNKER